MTVYCRTKRTAAAMASAVGLVVLCTPASVDAGVRAGAAEIVNPSSGSPLRSGGSRTAFRVKLPNGAACRGDSARAGYRVQTYLVPATIDPGGLAFDATGPSPVEGEFRAPLYDTTANQGSHVNQLTVEASPAGGPGTIIQPLPAFDFAVFDPAFGFPFTPGVYNVGVACTLGPPSPTQQDKHWNTVMRVTADPTDPGPAKIRWETISAAGSTATRASGSWPPAAVVGSLVAAGGGAVLLRRRRLDRQLAPHISRTEPTKETR